jgi:hypothetical protein
LGVAAAVLLFLLVNPWVVIEGTVRQVVTVAFWVSFIVSFLLAGSASTNPIMFTLAVGLMLAWRVAGYYGLDRYLLPMLGTPWRRNVDIRHGSTPATSSTS